MELSFVTSNKGKVKEAESILGFPIRIADIDLPEIQSLDLHEIVRAKALLAYEKVGKPVFVDDVGIFVDAWNGFPGPFIKYLREAGGNELLLRMLQQESIRTAVTKAVIGYYDGGKVEIFEGVARGEIVRSPRGADGWGFDPIFQPEGSSLTWSEMGDVEKNKISHRSQALAKFKDFLHNKS